MTNVISVQFFLQITSSDPKTPRRMCMPYMSGNKYGKKFLLSFNIMSCNNKKKTKNPTGANSADTNTSWSFESEMVNDLNRDFAPFCKII